MEQSQIKRYAAYLEIYILVSIAFVVIGRLMVKYHVEDVAKNNKEASGLLGKNPSGVMNKTITTKFKPIFKKFTSFLTPIFKIFSKILNSLKGGINKLRAMLSPIRDFFYNMTKSFFDKIQRFTIGVLYTLHKMRNSMRRTLSGFNLIYHTMEHQKNMLESLVKSPPIKAAVSLLEPVEWVGKMFKKLLSPPPPPSCFLPETNIELLGNKYRMIKDLKINDILADGSYIISVHKFVNCGKESIYNYKNVLVTGDHYVNEYNKWVLVKDSVFGFKVNIDSDLLYCLSTSNGIIKIKNILFKDYSESQNRQINYTINSLVLLHLNNYKFNTDIYSFDSNYLEHGFCSETLIEMENGSIKKIKDINLGEKIKGNNNEVLGIVEINPKFLDFYQDDNVLVSSNMKILEHNIWKNVEKSNSRKINYKPEKVYNLVTKDNTIPVFMSKIYPDYIETSDPLTNQNIEQIVSFA